MSSFFSDTFFNPFQVNMFIGSINNFYQYSLSYIQYNVQYCTCGHTHSLLKIFLTILS
jgi:hypothetical protein